MALPHQKKKQNRMTASSKIKHPSTPRYLFKRERNTCLHKNVGVHGSFIQNNQKHRNHPNAHQLANI